MSDLFNDGFPYYLSLGMTPHQYWCEDPWLIKAYRKKREYEDKHSNYLAWLQGRYIYEAISDNAGILNCMVTTPHLEPYRSRPIAITKQDIEAEQEEQEKAHQQDIKAYLMSNVNN